MLRISLKHAIPMGLALVLSACATRDQTRFVDAASTPLNDLNLVRVVIPELLVVAQKQPYAVPEERHCESLMVIVQELDAVLGPDLDAPKPRTKPDLMEKGALETKNAAVGAVRRTAEGVVPFRSWIRKLTGAERRSKQIAAAIAAGTARRAFIKGLGVANNCVWYPPAPVEPIPESTPEPIPEPKPESNP
jgi:hypothetical protein